MPRIQVRALAVCASVAGLCACAQTGPRLQPLDFGDAELTAPLPAPHHNLFFHRASYSMANAPPALSSQSKIADLCADAQAKAVLDRDLPGLTDRPEFDFFKHMSLQTLKKMSRGKMTDEDVAKVDLDLATLRRRTQTASLP